MQTYVLALDTGKWYIGRTTNLDRRLRQHFTCRGSKWCKKYEPQRVVLVRTGDCEKKLTLQLMRVYGIENVRGGPWCTLKEPNVRSTTVQPAVVTKLKMSVTTLAETTPSDWVFTPQKNKYGQNEFDISLNGTKTHPRVQPCAQKLPMRCCFGISQYNDQGSYSISLALSPYHEDARKWFADCDKFFLQWAWEHKSELFTRIPLNKDVLESQYTPLLQPSKGDYDPMIRLRISLNVPIWLLTPEGSKRGNAENVTAGSMVVPILSFDKVWTNSGRWGVTMRCQGLICTPREEQKLENMFIFDPMEVDGIKVA